MKSILFVISASLLCLLALPAAVHAQAALPAHALPALPQGAEPRIGRYVEFIVDDGGDGLAAGHFTLPFNPNVATVVLFPEDIEHGRGFPGPELQLDIRGRTAALFTTRRRLKKDLQRNLTLFSANLSVGMMVTAVDDPDDAIALAVVRRRSQVERWNDERADYLATRERENERDTDQRSKVGILERFLAMRTAVQPTTVLGDVVPHSRDATEVTISNFQAVWSGNEMLLKFEVENTGATPFEWVESRAYGKDSRENHAGAASVELPADPAEGLVGRLPGGERAHAAILVERARDISGPMTIVLGETGGGRQVMAVLDHWMPLQTRHTVQQMELRPVEPPDPERDKVSLHLQGVYGAVWLGDGAGLGKSDATSLKGLGVRAQYAFNRWLAFEGEVMGAGTGNAQFEDVTFEGMQGDLTRSASLGRAQFGGVLRFGQGTYVPLARLGVGLQGASHSGTLTTATGAAPGPDEFEVSALFHFGTGLDLRLGNHLVAGLTLTSVLLAKSTSPDIAAQISIEAGIHLGYAWHASR